MKTSFFSGLRYGFFKPVSYTPEKSYPLIIYLHGSGDTTSWNHKWYNDPIQTDDPCFVITPKSLDKSKGWGSCWRKKHSKNMLITLKILENVIKEYNIDTNRLYICGTSMGGFGVFSVLSKEPGKFAAAYATCGGGDPKYADKVLQTPLWIFHGEIDDIVPVRLSRDIYSEIIKQGGKNVRYTEYPGVKHNSWENVGKEKTLTKWFMSQRKGVKHESPDPVENFKISPTKKERTLMLWWEKPQGKPGSDKEIWYYKLYKNNKLIAEIENTETSFFDDENEEEGLKYELVAVNYFFKESKPAKFVYGE